MKKFLTFIICGVMTMSVGGYNVGADSLEKVPKGYKIAYETQEIVSYDCLTQKETITKETYKVYVPVEGEEDREEFELIAPEYTPDGVKSLGYDKSTLNTKSGSLQRISKPQNYGEFRSMVYIDVYAKNGNVLVYVNRGSGFMIGPNTVATAGHVIYDSEYASKNSNGSNWAYVAYVSPARSGNTYPYGTATSTSMICGGDWSSSFSDDDDWGIIRLNSNPGNQTGYLGLRYTSGSYHGEDFMYAGYPTMTSYDKYLYYGTGSVSSYVTSGVVYATGVLAKKGHSGCPVYQYRSTGYTAGGILTREPTNGFGFVKMTQWLYNKFMSYRNLTA